MNEDEKTISDFRRELSAARARIDELEGMEAECKEVLSSLRESEGTARALLNAPANVAFLINPEGIVIGFNENARMRTRFTEKELRGLSLWENVFPPSLVPLRRERVADAIRMRRPVHFDEVRRAIPYEDYFHPLAGEDGAVDRVAIVSWSVADWKKLEKALGQKRDTFRRVAEGASEAALELGDGGRIEYANTAAVNIFGYGKAVELPGLELADLLRPAPGPTVKLNAVAVGAIDEPVRMLGIRKDGREFPVWVFSTVASGRGQTRTVRVLVSDLAEREMVETALRAGEEERALSATVSRFAVIVNNEGLVVAMSDATKESVRTFPGKAVVGTSFLEYLPHELAITKKRNFEYALRAGTPVLLPDEFPEAIYENDVYPILDAEGGVTRLAYFCRDVTERKVVERELDTYRRNLEKLVEERTKELRESEERFRKVFENSVIGLYRTTPDGRILLANPSLIKMLGYTSFEELRERNLEESWYEPGYPRNEFKKRIEEDGVVVGLESGWRREDGTTLFIRESARAVRDEDGNTLYYEGTVEDITERKKAEAALRASEERYRGVLVNSPDGVICTDLSGRILAANDKAATLCNVDGPEDLRGTYVFDYLVPEDKERARASLAEVLEKGAITSVGYRLYHKDGSFTRVEADSKVVRDGGGQPCALVGVFRGAAKIGEPETGPDM
jgi:PAS domain S-box-containing protein